jgi:hypothetical protein
VRPPLSVVFAEDYPEVRAAAGEAQARLSDFQGLHMTPEEPLDDRPGHRHPR